MDIRGASELKSVRISPILSISIRRVARGLSKRSHWLSSFAPYYTTFTGEALSGFVEMMGNTDSSDVIYYPFSRCINIPTLKQFLLLFETISFCDPVDDNKWRDHLFRGLEKEDPRFSRYRDLGVALPALSAEGIVRTIDPKGVEKINDRVTTDAILADLHDKDWMANASQPQKFGLPVQRDITTGKPTWNVFKPKLPERLLEKMTADRDLHSHIIFDGGEEVAWNFSYAAGSAIGINTHLAVAHEYGLSPVTDSSLHHQLLLKKMSRPTAGSKSKISVTNEIAELLTRQTITRVMQQWLSEKALDELAIEQILTFRNNSRTLRQQFFSETHRQIEKQIAGATSRKLQVAAITTSDLIVKQAREYQNEMEGLRDKLWPNLLSAVGSKSGLIGLGATFGASAILSPAQMLIGSIPAIVAPAKVLLQWNASRRKLTRKSTSSVAYLASIAKQLG